MKIDNFLLTTFQMCPAKYELRAREHWTARRKSGALGAGTAIHAGLAEWYRTKNPARALARLAQAWPAEMPLDDWRTKQKALEVMAAYIRNYEQEPFTVVSAAANPMIECTFTLPTGLYLDCPDCPGSDREEVDGRWVCENCAQPLEEIEYGGIFDGLIEFSASLYILEHKTTSMLGPFYFNQFKPNNQVTGYIWAAEVMSGQRVGGALINAIGMYKSSATKFERQITTRSELEIKEWLHNLKHVCQMIRDCEQRNYWPLQTASCCLYGRCEFHDVHVLSTPREREKILEQNYIREQWNYEDRDD